VSPGFYQAESGNTRDTEYCGFYGGREISKRRTKFIKEVLRHFKKDFVPGSLRESLQIVAKISGIKKMRSKGVATNLQAKPSVFFVPRYVAEN